VCAEGTELHITVFKGTADRATISVLAGLLLPTVQTGRLAAERAQSQNNLKQIALGLHNYHSAEGHFPARAIRDPESRPLLSWRVTILPYLEGEAGAALYKEFHLDEPWNSEHNQKLIARMPGIYANPTMKAPGKTNYLAVVGDGTIFGSFAPRPGLQMREVTDGLSNTIMTVEVDPDLAVEWTKPNDFQFDPERPLTGLGKLRASGFEALFSDGRVRTIPLNVDAEVLRALMTHAGGEIVALPGN
jgi:hypothetical protein